mmetsp:Transcript_26689/g.42337  ORF Transcript_26689/g.42337 Transcript_26689/m.42337 type:complete len:297 (+) Transcript_26689:121-1011(+)
MVDKGEQWRPPKVVPADNPCTPAYCRAPPPDLELNCSQSDQLKYGKYLGAGRSKTVVIATWQDRKFALKSSALKGHVQSPKGQWPVHMRNTFLRQEYDIGVALHNTYGLQAPYGSCFKPEGSWVVFRFGDRGEFSEELARNVSQAAALKMALSAAMLHACIERHRFGFAWIKDNGRKQYIVHTDWSIELVDIEGLQFYPKNHKGWMGNKPCRVKKDCLANPNHPNGMSPDEDCDRKTHKCYGAASPSMVYTLGMLFLRPLALSAPALGAVADRCMQNNRLRRPTAAEIVEDIRKLM